MDAYGAVHNHRALLRVLRVLTGAAGAASISTSATAACRVARLLRRVAGAAAAADEDAAGAAADVMLASALRAAARLGREGDEAAEVEGDGVELPRERVRDKAAVAALRRLVRLPVATSTFSSTAPASSGSVVNNDSSMKIGAVRERRP